MATNHGVARIRRDRGTEQQHLLCAKKTQLMPRKPGVRYTILLTVSIWGHVLVGGGHAALGRPLRWGHLDVVVRSTQDLSSWKTDDSPSSAPSD